MKKSELKKIVKEAVRQMLNEAGVCNPPFMSGGEGNACGVDGDCSGTLTSSMLGGGMCLCKVAGGGVIQGGTDAFCPQGEDTLGGGIGTQPLSGNQLLTPQKGAPIRNYKGNQRRLREQGSSTTIRARVKTCQGGLQQYQCLPGNVQLGDRFTAVVGPSGGSTRQVYVKAILGGMCTGVTVTPPNNDPCPACENEDPSTFSCANVNTGGSGGCQVLAAFPANFNLQNWTNTWTNNNAFQNPNNNPNQPCNHICGRIQNWTSQLTGVGPAQANMLHCKIAEGNNQSQIHSCNC